LRREERAQQLWSVLALAATNRQILSYGIVAKLTGVPPPSIGDFLRPIQQFCIENKLPALTSIVVQEETGIPGEGFIASEDVPAEQAKVFQRKWLEVSAPSAEQLFDAYSRAPDRRGRSTEITESSDHLPINLIPSDPNTFKQHLLHTRVAEIMITYRDGRVERRIWNAPNFRTSSNVIGNLRSRPEFRAGQWQAEGIAKVTVTVLQKS
jgi:alkylated DNA nucleotide flippase Atl1